MNNLNAIVHTTFMVCVFSTFNESNSIFIIYLFSKIAIFKY